MLEFAGVPELAARFGLGSRELDDPDGMIPLPVLHALLEALVEVTGDPCFGLHFGASGDPSEFKRRVGALGLMLLTSPTMAAGMNALARHQNLFNEGDRYAVVERGSDTRICFEPWGPERLGQIQMAEKTVAQVLVLLSLAEPGIQPRAIELAHAERPDSQELTRTLGLAPKFGAGQTAVVVRTEDMQRPIRGADPDLFRFFDRHLIATAGDTPPAAIADESAAALATEAVRDSLHRDVFSSVAVAEQLGLSLRTLQRRLAAEGTSVSAIVEGVRRVRAESLLRAGMPVAEVAVMLGYSGTTAFVRAFRRWLGTTPAVWRDTARKTG
jgi:AraC-like DNA-binding protein